MQLKHTEIPLRFLQQLPEGIKYIHRHGKEFLVVEQLYCRAAVDDAFEGI